MFGERGFVRWHLEDDGAGEVQLVPYDPDGSTQSFLFDSLDELDPRVAQAVRLDGRSAGETPWPPAWG